MILLDPRAPLVKTYGLNVCALESLSLMNQSSHQGGVHSATKSKHYHEKKKKNE